MPQDPSDHGGGKGGEIMPGVDLPGTSQYCPNCEALAKKLAQAKELLRRVPHFLEDGADGLDKEIDAFLTNAATLGPKKQCEVGCISCGNLLSTTCTLRIAHATPGPKSHRRFLPCSESVLRIWTEASSDDDPDPEMVPVEAFCPYCKALFVRELKNFESRSALYGCGTSMVAGVDAQNYRQSKECKNRLTPAVPGPKMTCPGCGGTGGTDELLAKMAELGFDCEINLYADDDGNNVKFYSHSRSGYRSNFKRIDLAEEISLAAAEAITKACSKE
jgi:hypothetical protein